MKNMKYVDYHDKEWCIPKYEDNMLLELLILESFQAGLSWECVLNKREDFRLAFDNFDIDKVITYDDEKINELMQNRKIIRNRLKILSAINNSKVFKEIQTEYGSFSEYIWSFSNNTVIYEVGKVSSDLSDMVSKDLKKRGMKFVGTTIIYSYLQAIGMIYSHENECFLYKGGEKMYIKKGVLSIREAKVEDAEILAGWWNDGKVMAHAGFPSGLGITVEKVVENILKTEVNVKYSYPWKRLFEVEVEFN